MTDVVGSPRVSLEGITRRFGSTVALRDAHFDVHAGEVHALVGANGAGKSTLVKIMSGAERADEGQLTVGSWRGRVLTPRKALNLGIRTIYQDSSLAPTLDACQNVVLGEESSSMGFLPPKRQRAEAQEILSDLGFQSRVDVPVGGLRPADQQLIEIAKALHGRSTTLILDEPTAALGYTERENLFTVVRNLAGRDVAVVYIAHDLEEVLRVSDRVTVMRDGANVRTSNSLDETPDTLVTAMVGAEVSQFPRVAGQIGAEVLVARGLHQGGRLHDASLTLHEGEVVGVTGLVGSGRTRLVNVLAGLSRADSGTMTLSGKPYAPSSPKDAIRAGVALVPEDRKRDSLLMHRASTDSIMLSSSLTGPLGVLRGRREQVVARDLMVELRVKPPRPQVPPIEMSGGNQQKVSIAKALKTEAPVLILDEPGQGVDVAAKAQIFQSIHELAQQGHAIVIVSSELEELNHQVDRLIVMHRGRIADVLEADEIAEHTVLSLSMTGRREAVPTEETS